MTDSIPLLGAALPKHRRYYNISLITLSSIFGLAILYTLTFYLPSLLIPEGTPLDPILTFKEFDRSFIFHVNENAHTDADAGADTASDFAVTKPLSDSLSTNHPMNRLIVVGDIHGCYDLLMKLLKKLDYKRGHDQILALGDVITKGPDSISVLDFLIENDAACIIGNHEYYVLNHYANYHHIKFPGFVTPAGEIIDDIPKSVFSHKLDPEFVLAKRLQPRHVKFLNKCPVIQHLGPVPNYKQSSQDVSRGAWSSQSVSGVAVHAGLQWERSLVTQNPIDNFEMRSLLGPEYTIPTNDANTPNSMTWSKIFNAKQKDKTVGDALAVYYGHEASRGLNLRKFTKGLDTGCVGGGELLAMVLWKRHNKHTGELEHWEKLVSVKCSD